MSGHGALVAYLEERSGLRFAGAQRARMIQALEESAARRGRAPDAAYRALLDRDQTAFDDLAGLLTVPETHFYREPSGVAVLQQAALEVAARRRPHEPVAVWSAGCASGEEAYTVAMATAEVGLGEGVRVLGTDLSPRALAKAERGVYGRWSLRGVDQLRRRRWFVPDSGGYRVRDDLRDRVRFRCMNLLAGAPGRFDIVVCRNVLIYFTPDAARRAAGVLWDALRLGGWLLTGVSDPPLALPGLEVVATSRGLAYRRLTAGHDLPAPPPGPAAGPQAAPERTTEVPPSLAAAPAPRPPTTTRDDVAGRDRSALAAVERAIAQDPLDPRLRYHAAALQLEAGRATDAVAAARAALFLDPGLTGAAAVLLHARHAQSGADDAAAEASSNER